MPYRFRYRNNLNTVSGSIIQELYSKDCSTGVASWTQTWNGPKSYKVGRYEMMYDFVTPDFRRRSRNGDVIMSPMSYLSYEVDAGYGSAIDTVTTSTATCTNPDFFQQSRRYETGVTLGRAILGGDPTILASGALVGKMSNIFSDSEIESAVNEASTKARAARGSQANSNQWEALAELDKSLGMMNQALGNANQFFSKHSRIVERCKAAANSWLLYRYGVVPVMLSIEDAAKSVDRAVGRVRQTSRGNISLSKTKRDVATKDLFSIYRQDYAIETYSELSVRCTILDEVEATWWDNAGLSMKNLAMLPWELLPYSFVVDWFANVGDYLASLYPLSNAGALGSCTVIEINTSLTWQSTSCSLTHSYWNQGGMLPPHGFTAKEKSKSRRTGVAEPVLMLRNQYRMTELLQSIDAISLLTQKLK